MSIRTLFNKLRLNNGLAPIFVTTSESKTGTDAISRDALRARPEAYAGHPWHYEAASRSYFNPIGGKWDIWMVAQGKELAVAEVSYDRMRDFLKNSELSLARQTGEKGTEDEILARREKEVSPTNVLRFLPKMCPNA